MVTSSEIKTFQSATSSELRQAQSLIFRGKAFAARGDPRLQRIIAVVGSLNQLARDRAIRQAKAREKKSRAFIGPTRPFTPRPKPVLQSFPKPKPKKIIRPTKSFTPKPKRKVIPKPKRVITQILKPTIIRRPVPKIIRKRIPTIRKTALKIADIVSGRAITRSNISKKQEGINRKIESFNREFGGQTLSEGGFARAQKQSSSITKEQEVLDKEQEKFEKSKAKKIGDFVFRTETIFPKPKDIPKEVKKKESELKKTQTKLKKAKGLNKKRLRLVERGIKKDIQRIKRGEAPKVLADSIPITPIGIPTGKTNLIRFVGKQKKVGNKIVTDIVFETNGKRIGFARGVSIAKGKKTTTITVGRSGVQGRKFPTAKRKIGRLQTFVAAEKGVAKQRSLDIKREVKLIKGVKATVIKKNVKFLQQASAGRVASVKGSKLIRTGIKFPSGKIIKIKQRGIQLDDFASISSAFTKKDLSLIIGKTITGKGDKARFIGLIKGSSKAKKGFSVSGRQQQEFNIFLYNCCFNSFD